MRTNLPTERKAGDLLKNFVNCEQILQMPFHISLAEEKNQDLKKKLRKCWTKYAIDVQIDEEIFAHQADIDNSQLKNGGVAEW